MVELDKVDMNDGSFSIIAYKDEENVIVMAEGNTEELSDIFGIMKEIHSELDLQLITLAKEEYTAKKQYISLLNSYLSTKISTNNS